MRDTLPELPLSWLIPTIDSMFHGMTDSLKTAAVASFSPILFLKYRRPGWTTELSLVKSGSVVVVNQAIRLFLLNGNISLQSVSFVELSGNFSGMKVIGFLGQLI